MNLPWIDEAKKYIGLKETPGAGNTPEIVQFWNDIRRGGIHDDATPWCAAFVGAVLEHVGIQSSRFESAASYLTWGVDLEEPVRGAIVVFSRDGGGHVGFVLGQDNIGQLLVLGGNQSDEVCVRAFQRRRVTGYRWPAGQELPPDGFLPVLSTAALSRSEA